MAEAAGLAIGAIALASLATDCIECFDIIELAKTHSRDLEILETSLEAQKVRLIIWLQANGLAGPIPYNTTLDDPDIRGSLDRALNCIKLLFEDSEALRRMYGLQAIHRNSIGRITTSGSRRIPVFNETYRRFRMRLKSTQQSTTTARKIKWAIQDRNKFKTLIEDLKSMIDVVENITHSAEQLQRRRELIAAEVEVIVDEERLQLVQEVASLSDNDDLSSAASRRIRLLAGTIASGGASFVGTTDNTIISEETFYSAQSHIAQVNNTIPLGTNDGNQERPKQNSESNVRTLLEGIEEELSRYGYANTSITQTTSSTWKSHHWTKRMLKELSRSQSDLPLVGFAPVYAGDMSYLLGHFLGPIDTPYEGGTFYVRIHISKDYPWEAPVCQLLTRVYHPNIDANGRICLDTLYDQWTPGRDIRYMLLCISTLLDTPDTSDPLVPEIAATYTKDPAEYSRIAKLYTAQYATGEKPVLPLANENALERPWWQDVKISAEYHV